MSRRLVIPLAALALVPLGSLRAAPEPVAVAPMPRAVAPRLALAPMPHEPGDLDLTSVDVGLDAKIEAALPEIDRLDKITVEAPVAIDPIGLPPLALPDAPGLPPHLLPAPAGFRDDPPGKMPLGAFAGRSGATKDKLLKNTGGNGDTEKAVALGLAWLAKQQKADGSWEFDGTARTERAAATGFAVLAFLGAGETHKDAKGKYQKNVKAGLDWLVKATPVNGANAGRTSTNMYTQGIAALALIEAYGQTQDPALKPVAQAAVNYIQKAQGPNGSWGYSTGTNGDTSIVGWQLQALFAAQRSKGLVVDAKVITKAIGFLDKAAAGANKEHYGYNDNAGAAPGTSLTAVGLWCRVAVDGWGTDNAGLAKGASGLLKRPAAKNRLDLYYLHYATMVLKSAGPETWAEWNEGPKAADGTRKGGLRDVLVGAQLKDGDKAGSWDPDAVWIGSQCGRVGTTALSIINLESYYRYLPPPEKKGDK